MAFNADIGTEHNGKISVPINAGNFQPRVSNGCAALQNYETTAGNPDISHLAFDGASAEYAQLSILMPKRWDGGPISFIPAWTGLAAGAGNVIWRMAAVCVDDDGTIDTAFGTAISCTAKTFTVAEDMHKSVESGDITVAGSPAGGKTIFVELSRDPATDTRTQDASFLGMAFIFTASAMNDD